VQLAYPMAWDPAAPAGLKPTPYKSERFICAVWYPSNVFLTSRAAAAEWATHTRAAGKRIVFTNGVFDILHPGHVRYLQAARAEGDTLIIGLNSDRSVSAIKGPTRPITPEHERAEILGALRCVDAVVVFDEDTPFEIISAVQPDVLVKGADWAADKIVGRDVVEARGGKVVRMPIEQGWSTTGIVAKVSSKS
jgi:D-beta-D-heptose 7-phosphate kinase/D-beta-D-heptose 1-phosphate adenosyltransferase